MGMKIHTLVAAAAVVLSTGAMAQTVYRQGEYHAATSVNGSVQGSYEVGYGNDYRQVPHGDCDHDERYQQVQYAQPQPYQAQGYYTQVWVPQTCQQYGYQRICSGGYYRQEWIPLSAPVPAPVVIRPRVVVPAPVVVGPRFGVHVGHRFGRHGRW